MCFWGFHDYKLHYACVGCRLSFKQVRASEHVCPRCGEPLQCAGHDFAPPPRRDAGAWSAVAAVLAEGLRYEGREACGCGKEPKYRPGTRAELRTWRAERAAEAAEG